MTTRCLPAIALLVASGIGSCTLVDGGADGGEEPRCLDVRLPPPAHPFPVELLRARRAAVSETMGTGIGIWPGAWEPSGPNGSLERQESEVYYLTGLEAKGVWLVLVARESGDDKTLLYVDPAEGGSPSDPTAAQLTGISDVRCLSDAPAEMPPLIGSVASPARQGGLYLSGAVFRGTNTSVLAVVDTTGFAVAGTSALVGPLRTTKDTEEIERLRQAARVTALSLVAGMRGLTPGRLEGDLQTTIETRMLALGAARMSFPSIVASGANALDWHYQRNTSDLQMGDLVLVDVGAEVGRYAGDVTRTLPVSGRFSDRQRALYELVLRTKAAAAEALRPGITLSELEGIARATMRAQSNGLCGVETCDAYFGHGLSHHLGLDVHDYGPRSLPLSPGMVITIEPGLYLPDEGIGIRIEDDYLITSSGHEVLSADAPTTVHDIEQEMAGSRPFW